MIVRDFVESYITHVDEHNDLESYIKICPSLFDHYFTYWADRNRFVNEFNPSEIRLRREIVLRAMSKCETVLKSAGFQTDLLSIILFVGVGTSNGHAYYDDDRIIVWIPVETYATDLFADVFLPHEIFHALHYLQLPSYYFCNHDEKHHVGRQLITEGIASYLTAEIMRMSDSTALWADYLKQDQLERWMDECTRRSGEVSRFVIDRFHCTGSDLGIFRADHPDDIFNYRVGYFLGLNVIRELVTELKLKPIELLSLGRDESQDRCFRILESFALQ